MSLSRTCHVLCRTLFCLALWLAGPAAAQVTDRPMSVGLNGISDWSTQHPFLDLMKTARPWIGHLPGQWGGVSFEDLQAQGAIDENGWPRRVPAEVSSLEALILTDQPVEATHLAGRYHVFFTGQGRFEITGNARVIRRAEGHRVFAYTPGDGPVGLQISATEASDPIRGITVVKQEHLDLHAGGARFNPLWTDKLDRFGTIRFMDWMETNNATRATWDDMPKETDFSYSWRGVPLGTIVDLANTLQADPWINLPHLADDALVRAMADQVKTTLDPGLVVHLEYSNEVWNFIFDQARWAQQQAEAHWGEVEAGWMQLYGLRAAQVMDIWTDSFGPQVQARLKRVVAVHTGWPGLERAVLQGAQARAVLGRDPAQSFDAYAVTGYFGHELGAPDATEALLDTAEARARATGTADGLSRVALREHVRAHRFDGTFAKAAETVRAGSFREMTERLWPHHAQVADRHGYELLMYEGGTHAAAQWDAVDNDRLVGFLNAFNYSAEMGALYRDAIRAWHAAGGASFNVFVDVAPPGKWGSWGALRHLDDDTPRWRAVHGD